MPRKLVYLAIIVLVDLLICTAAYCGLDSGTADDGLGHLRSNSLFDPNEDAIGTADRSSFYYPSGIAMDVAGHRLFVSDTYNNRVLIFNLNTDNNLENRNADYVLGQATFSTNLANGGQPSPAGNTLSQPTGLAFSEADNRLYVADSYNSRVLIFDVEEIQNGEYAIAVIGQESMSNGTKNRGNPDTADENGLSGPTNVLLDEENNRLWVSDTGNHRILLYTLPISENGPAAVNVLGQSSFAGKLPNRGGSAPAASTFIFPSGLVHYKNDTDDSLHLWVADAGNSRILHYDVTGAVVDGADALHVLGQEDFVNGRSNRGQTTSAASSLNQPKAIAYDPTSQKLYVADSDNHRIMVFDISEDPEADEEAIAVIGQGDFVTREFNRGADLPASNSLNYPSALGFYGEVLIAADTRNNRLTLFHPSAYSPLGASAVATPATAATTSSDESSGGGCFIATSCLSVKSDGTRFLSLNAVKKLNALRNFRDRQMLTKSSGRKLIRLYYTLGPGAADMLEGKAPLKKIIRNFLIDPNIR